MSSSEITKPAINNISLSKIALLTGSLGLALGAFNTYTFYSINPITWTTGNTCYYHYVSGGTSGCIEAAANDDPNSSENFCIYPFVASPSCPK